MEIKKKKQLNIILLLPIEKQKKKRRKKNSPCKYTSILIDVHVCVRVFGVCLSYPVLVCTLDHHPLGPPSFLASSRLPRSMPHRRTNQPTNQRRTKTHESRITKKKKNQNRKNKNAIVVERQWTSSGYRDGGSWRRAAEPPRSQPLLPTGDRSQCKGISGEQLENRRARPQERSWERGGRRKMSREIVGAMVERERARPATTRLQGER